MWGTVTNAAIHLAMCISQDYSNNIRDKIRLLKERTISPVEYTDALLEIYRWKMNHDESTSEILRILQALQLQNVEILDALRYQRSTNNHDNIVPATVARDLQSSESHADICTVIGNHHSHESHYDVVSRNQWSTYDHGKTNRQAVEETECKTVDEHDSVINEDDAKYFKLFGEVNQLRQKGEEDTKCGTLYSILVYIVLHGSATEAEINYEILSNIYKSIYKTAIPSENICIESCLAELVPTYLDQVDEKFTPCNITIVKAVVYFFGNESCECFVKNCSLDIMMDYVVPSCTSIEDFHVVVDIYVLASALVQRIKSKSDARPVGKYVFKAFFDHKNIEISNLFIDTLEQSKEHFTSDHMIHLLDGLTKDGTKFSIFDKLEKLFNVFCRQVDKSGNTILHYLVTRFSESKRFHAYIKFFCESNIVVMQLENDDNHSPIDFAAYQGRYDVIADILSNTESTEEITSRILTMVKEGVDSLQRINLSKSSVDSKLHIATKKSITLGDSKDYENILDIIGRQENACLSDSDVKEEEEEKTPDDEKAKRKADCSEDISKTVGDGILNMVTEIKKGLNAITKIPNLIKTIHQATKIEDED